MNRGVYNNWYGRNNGYLPTSVTLDNHLMFELLYKRKSINWLIYETIVIEYE